MINDQDSIVQFYDQFFKDVQQTKVNERIFYCYDKMKKAGLRSNSTVLELGCGPGVLTSFLGKKIRTGTVEAVDISPYAIEFAKAHVKNKKVRFYVHDIVSYTCVQKSFDFITLFDVLEHVPLSTHRSLFLNIERNMEDHSLLLINIPNPRYLEYDRIQHPETLQIIDQPLHPEYLAQLCADTGLFLYTLETNSIWVEDDYQFLVVRKKQAFIEKKLSDRRNFRQKIFGSLKRKWKNFIFST